MCDPFAQQFDPYHTLLLDMPDLAIYTQRLIIPTVKPGIDPTAMQWHS